LAFVIFLLVSGGRWLPTALTKEIPKTKKMNPKLCIDTFFGYK